MHFMLLVTKNGMYFLLSLYFYFNNVQDYPIEINVKNELGQKKSNTVN